MTEQERFDRCLGAVLRLEGGFCDDVRDPGGPTNLGVTLATLTRARGRPATVQEVRALTPADAAPIYRDLYWRPAGCGRLAPGLDLLVFDTAVNMGVGAATALLQRPAGAAGEIAAYAGRRAARYRALPGFPVFGAGWMRRLRTVRAQAEAWAAEAVPPGAAASA